MNKTELIEHVAKMSNKTKGEVSVVMNAFVETIFKTLKNGEKVSIQNLGTFEKVHRPARQGTNPATREKIMISAKNAPKFKAAKTFKDHVA